MRTPVPKVFAWSSTSNNPVGAEYILMEHVSGVQLSKIWDRLDVELKFQVVKKVASYQENWLLTQFSRYGSLYYKHNLKDTAPSVEYTNENGLRLVDDRFAVGPSTSRQTMMTGELD